MMPGGFNYEMRRLGHAVITVRNSPTRIHEEPHPQGNSTSL